MASISFDPAKSERNIAGRLHALVFTPRVGKVHVISLRKANRRETRHYEAQDQHQEKGDREP